MKRALSPEERALWSHVAATARPLGAKPGPGLALPHARVRHDPPPPPAGAAPGETKALEPNRLRRLERERGGFGPRLDLHGLTQDEARGRLMRFLGEAQADGWRAVVVITGRGLGGEGILRRRAPEWLAEPHLDAVVAGIAPAHRRHGGDGALYVALKRLRTP